MRSNANGVHPSFAGISVGILVTGVAIVPDGVHTKGKKFGRGGILKAEWLCIHVSHKCV